MALLTSVRRRRGQTDVGDQSEAAEGQGGGEAAVRRAWVAAVLALLMVVAALIVVLGSSGPRLAASNTKVIVSDSAITVGEGTERCQGGEYVPREAVRLRVYPGSPMGRPTGEPLAISILDSAGREVTQAAVPPGYRSSRPLDVAIGRRDRDVAPGSLCIRNLGTHPVMFARTIEGELARTGPGARPEGEIRADYFRGGRESWLDLSPEIARRFELFKPSFFGPWTMWATLAVVVVAGTAAVLLVLRSLRRRPREDARRLPAAGWACAVIAVANAAGWAAVTPTFQVPDEPQHVGYARYLAAKGRPPLPPVPGVNEPRLKTGVSEAFAISHEYLPFSVEGDPSWSGQQDRAMRRALDGDISRISRWDAGWASNYPPAYYAFEAAPARFGPGANVVDKLLPMRLASALLAGLTVAFVYLFLREVLPSTPWAWVTGSLAVAFQPVFGFLAGGVNNDNLLFSAGAVLLFAVARAFRAGLTPRLGLLMGAAGAVGVLAKTTMATMLPAAALAVGFLCFKGRASGRQRAVRGAVTALAGLVVILGAWYLVDAMVLHRSPGAPAAGLASAGLAPRISLRGQLSYLWQSFLPPLPFMAEQFPGYPHYLVWDHYIEGFIGRFGWFQYGFPLGVNQAGFAVLVAVAVLAVAALVRRRREVRRRWAELACYLLVVVSMLVVNGVVGYRFRAATGFNFEQPRYLFPALALYGAVVALAALGAGRRWGPAVAAFLSVVAVGHSLFAMLLTIGRYYA